MAAMATKAPHILPYGGISPTFATPPAHAGAGSAVLGRVTLGRERFLDYAGERFARSVVDQMLYAHMETDKLFKERTQTEWIEHRASQVIEGFIRPTIDKAATAAGRPQPQVIAGVCVAVTDDPDAMREWIRTQYGAAGDMPSYRAVLDRGGKAGPADTAVLGDEETVAKELQRYADAGTSEFLFCPVGTEAEVERTVRFALDYA